MLAVKNESIGWTRDFVLLGRHCFLFRSIQHEIIYNVTERITLSVNANDANSRIFNSHHRSLNQVTIYLT